MSDATQTSLEHLQKSIVKVTQLEKQLADNKKKISEDLKTTKKLEVSALTTPPPVSELCSYVQVCHRCVTGVSHPQSADPGEPNTVLETNYQSFRPRPLINTLSPNMMPAAV